jgi:hypothetical protein
MKEKQEIGTKRIKDEEGEVSFRKKILKIDGRIISTNIK